MGQLTIFIWHSYLFENHYYYNPHTVWHSKLLIWKYYLSPIFYSNLLTQFSTLLSKMIKDFFLSLLKLSFESSTSPLCGCMNSKIQWYYTSHLFSTTFDILSLRNRRSQWPSGLSRGSAATCLLILWVRIPPHMDVVCRKVEVSATSWSLVQNPANRVTLFFVIYYPQEWEGHDSRWVTTRHGKITNTLYCLNFLTYLLHGTESFLRS